MGIKRYFTQSIKSQRKTEVENGIGGWTDTWTDNISLKGCIRPLKGDEKFLHDKNTAESTHRLYCDILDIKNKDRIVANGITYEVIFVNNVMNMGRHLQVDLKVVE